MPEFTRRSMLTRGLGTLGSVTIGSMALGSMAQSAAAGDAASTTASRAAVDAPGLRRSVFLPALNTTFRASTSSSRYTLRLVEILDLVPAAVAGDDHAFNLVFEQSDGQPMRDGIYSLSADRVPAVSLFLSPVDRPGTKHRLQALINRRSG